MPSDLHLHPLSHKYYFAMIDGFSKVVLDEEDKRNIEAVVHWCLRDRGLDVIALTDHDMIQASLYAAEYVRRAGLPIAVITGAECSVCDPDADTGDNEVHLLCLGIGKLPRYDSETPVAQHIRAVHEAGGQVIMSHPVEYPDSFYRYCHLLDGYEYRNSDKPPFEAGKAYLARRGLVLPAYHHSDFHYEGTFPDAASAALHSNE